MLQRLLHHLVEVFVERVSDDVLFLQPIDPTIVVIIIIIDPLTPLLIITSPLTVGLENWFLLLELLLLLLTE